MTLESFFLGLLIFLVAALYASVGHGGASGYLALMALFLFEPRQMASTALLLNLFVAGLATISFARAGHFVGRLLWPFAITSVPAAYLGGALAVPLRAYALLLAGVLVFAALRLLLPAPSRDAEDLKRPQMPVALSVGASVGLLSGIVGVGGGIFLSPLLLLAGWASPKQTAAVSAAFIVANSAAALLGRLSQRSLATETFVPLLLPAVAGGLIGATLGARLLPGAWLRRLLGVVLLVAAAKLIQSLLLG